MFTLNLKPNFKAQLKKQIKHNKNQALPTNHLGGFDHFVGLGLKGSK